MEAYGYLARAYNELMGDVDYDKWAAYINRLMNMNGARIFETACGTGNLSFRLYDLGHDVVASDISEAMLFRASKHARKTGRDVTFVRQDMRSFETGKPADAIVCACDGVNYVDKKGLKQFAECAFKSLKKGGLLLFDISTADKLKAMDGQVYFDVSDDVSCIWKNTFDAAREALTMDVILFARKGRLFERYDETHVLYAHLAENVRHEMAEAGFEDICCYAFMTTETYTEGPRAQFVCRKP